MTSCNIILWHIKLISNRVNKMPYDMPYKMPFDTNL